MKLRKKLLLSCAALAACATTLATTTYAWYTTNDTVTASSVVGETSVSSESLLLISDTGNAGDWGSTTDYADQTSAKVDVAFSPVAWKADSKSFTDMKGTNAVTDGFIAFDLYFATGSTSPETVYVKQFDIVLTQEGALPTKSVLTTEGLGDSWNATTNGTYKIDIRNALIVTTVATTIDAGEESVGNALHYGMESKATSNDDDYADGFNAHDYYNAVLGLEDESAISTEDNIEHDFELGDASSAIWSLGTAPVVSSDATAKNALKVTFYVWLNGWDTACFDAVQGQEITISMAFTSNATAERTVGADAA